MLYGSPSEGLTEKGAALMIRSAAWLARYRRMLPNQTEEHYSLVTVLAAATFEDDFSGEDSHRKVVREATVRFIRDNWESIDQTAMVIGVSEDLEDLGKL